MVARPRIRDATEDVLVEIAEQNDYVSLDRAMTHALREAGYDV